MLHTDIPTSGMIRQLATIREPYCVSIYLPTSPLPLEAEQARIDLGNLFATAVGQLEEAGASEDHLDRLKELIRDLTEDRSFWSYQSRSLVVFATSAGLQTFRLPNTLPRVVEVSDRLYIKPLLRAVTFPQGAFVLAISQGAARLVEISGETNAHVVAVPGMPPDASEIFGRRDNRDQTRPLALREGVGDKVMLAEYSRAIDKALRPLLTGLETPLILAGTEPVVTIYPHVNTYGHLASEIITGNPELLSETELAERARPILDKLHASELEKTKVHVSDAIGLGRGATDLSDLARAATFGAIDTLLVDIDQKVSGTLDEETGAITFSEADDAHDYGVIDEIVRRALLSGAKIFAVRAEDVPGGGAAAAITRFPV